MKEYQKYIDEALKGTLKTFPSTAKGAGPVDTEFYEAPFREKDFEKILATSNKEFHTDAIRAGIDKKGDIYAWRYDVWTRAIGPAHGVDFDYEIEAIRDGRQWRVIVKAMPKKGQPDEGDIPNIDEKVSHLIGWLPGTPPATYSLSDFTGKKSEERDVQ